MGNDLVDVRTVSSSRVFNEIDFMCPWWSTRLEPCLGATELPAEVEEHRAGIVGPTRVACSTEINFNVNLC